MSGIVRLSHGYRETRDDGGRDHRVEGWQECPKDILQRKEVVAPNPTQTTPPAGQVGQRGDFCSG
jgi:hypothetical protein